MMLDTSIATLDRSKEEKELDEIDIYKEDLFSYHRQAEVSSVCMCIYRPNGPGDQASIPGWVIPKTQKKKKKVLDTSLLNLQHYKVLIPGKSNGFPIHLSVVSIEKGAFGSPSTTLTNLLVYIRLAFTLARTKFDQEIVLLKQIQKGSNSHINEIQINTLKP